MPVIDNQGVTSLLALGRSLAIVTGLSEMIESKTCTSCSADSSLTAAVAREAARCHAEVFRVLGPILEQYPTTRPGPQEAP